VSKSASVPEQFALLKAMTIRTGAIHEAQRFQLERWPLLSDQIAIPVVVKIDFDARFVTMECRSKGKYKHKAFEKRLFSEICGWVRTILWDDTRLAVSVNKKILFDSARQ
jgi:hypothetical protein